MKHSPISIVRLSAPQEADKIAARVLCGGEFIAFADVAGIKKIVRAARRIARESFACEFPPFAHRIYSRDEFLKRAKEAQDSFRDLPPLKKHFADALGEIGFNCEEVFWDSLLLRIAPPLQTHDGGLQSHAHLHRDTWGVAIFEQMNWWAPIWPATRARTIGFFPDYFRRPLANTTAEWSFGKYLAARKAAPAGQKPDYPAAPVAAENPKGAIVPAAVAQNDVMCFSAAHLHGSIPNASALTRFSFEIRTVNLADRRAQRFAPNADCQTPKPAARIFFRIGDGKSLAELI